MDLPTIFNYIRNIIASLLLNLRLPPALAISLANFSLAAIAVVLLLLYPQIVILIAVVLFLLFGLKH